MTVDLLLGLQWGDEGKGKIVDVLTSKYDIIARFQGGPNAGHTLEFDGIKHVLRTIPSGIFHKNAINIIGNGVVIDPVVFQKEIEGLAKFNMDVTAKLFISRKAHLILPTHRLLDAASEAASSKRCVGKIKCAFLEISNLDFKSMLNFSKPSNSFWKTTGSITTPFPIMLIAFLWKIPEGIVLKTCLIPSNSNVCPAFGPP